uniref:Putative conserved secreted protein n=1 Tax=Panstrongylus lignarius TaxID=156445 RepID=A0A224XNY0_9HEMI
MTICKTMDIKIVFLLILSVCATSWAYPKTVCGSGPTHDLILGNRHNADRLLLSTREKMPESILRVKSRDFEWSAKHIYLRQGITRIEVLDQNHDGSGGCAFLTNGGVGQNYVKLHLKTQRGGSFDFFIIIYGK